MNKALIRPDVQALAAYKIPEPPRGLKLDAMENPWPWPGELQTQWLAAMQNSELNRYPDPNARALTQRIKQWLGLSEEQGLLLGNGSDELILILCQALGDIAGKRCVMAPEPGFVMYKHIAITCDIEYVGVPLLPDSFDLDVPTFLAAIDEHQPGLIFLACPNNPTGNLFSLEAIEAVIDAAPGFVVLDEAYTAFSSREHLALLSRKDTVLIMRTVSKLGLAGIRLGMLSGDTKWLNEFNKLRLPYNINTLTQKTALFALEHIAILDAQAAELKAQREWMLEQLRTVPNVAVWPSEANFILVRVPRGRAKLIHKELYHDGILIKCLDGVHPHLQDCLRITIGTAVENQQLMQAFTVLLAS